MPEAIGLYAPHVRLAAWLLLAILLAGCSPLLFLRGTSDDAVLQVRTGEAYGPLPRQRLDIYPSPGGGAPRPLVVFFYGGAWQRGERRNYRFAGEALAADGYVAVVADYRVYPEVRFPEFVRDGAAVVAWVRANIGRFGGDPARIYLMGHSAGAHIAALLALDPRYLRAEGLSPRDLRGFIGLAGPYDFLPIKSWQIKAVFDDRGEADTLAPTQPVNFASSDAPPALLLHGADDGIVRPRNTERLAARLRAVGAAVTEKIYSDVGHPGVVLALSTTWRHLAPVRADVARFIAATR